MWVKNDSHGYANIELVFDDWDWESRGKAPQLLLHFDSYQIITS